MKPADTHSKQSFFSRSWSNVVAVGCSRVSPEFQDRVQLSNQIAASLIAFGSLYVVIYYCVGLTLLANLILVSVIGSLGVLGLNSAGYNLAARYWQSYVFTISIMIFSVALGHKSGTTLLMCPALAVVFLNFTAREKRSLIFILVTTSIIAVATDFWLVKSKPLLDIPESYLPWLRIAAHLATFALLAIELFIFMNSNEKSRRAAESSSQLTNEILDAVSDSFIYVNRDYKIQYLNPNGQKIFNALGFESGIGLDFMEISLNYETGDHCARLREAIVSQTPYHEEYFETLMNCWFEVRSNPGPLGCSISYRDVSIRKTAEQQLIHSSKMSSLGEMAGAIAHEINNPMTIIQLSAEQLEISAMDEVVDGEEVAKVSARISETVTRITKIIRGLKNFSRNSDDDPMIATPIKTLIEDTVGLCQERFKNKGIELQVADAVSASILCRPTEVSQVLLNLMGNAFDAIEQRAGQRWVELATSTKLSESGTLILFRVTDCGEGIPEEVAKRILEPFFTTKGVGKGTGLGLSISKGIIETHGGRLYFDRSAKNTTFVVELKTVEASIVSSELAS
ncbi:MAG: hypothetical protein EOP05_03445 [Proteobacteria bacterium]|nr:MAG: hypothetical protein EOP05_03445 [Pseudomonadota bacterium]